VVRRRLRSEESLRETGGRGRVAELEEEAWA
jgi:hypothetical protein